MCFDRRIIREVVASLNQINKWVHKPSAIVSTSNIFSHYNGLKIPLKYFLEEKNTEINLKRKRAGISET